MKSNKFWATLLAALVLVSGASAFFLFSGQDGTVAKVYQNGELIHSVDLSRVEEPYVITVNGKAENTVSVENGRICVSHATCPDQVCVHQGWISNGVVPIVCLPNRLIIEIQSRGDAEVDAVSQ